MTLRLMSLLVPLVTVGCQLIQPVTNLSDTVSQRVEQEQQIQANKTAARVNCQQLCQDTLSSDGKNFEVGPCLSNNIAPDWVCDVAHQPRQAVDDDPANQCGAFLSGEAKHFVEVDGNCNVITAR